MTTETTTGIDPDHWSRIIDDSGVTTIPRWPSDQPRGDDTLEVDLPPAALSVLRQSADDLAVPLSAIFVAAHAKVLAALAGEEVVVAGYSAGDLPGVLPCRLPVRPGSWRALIEEAHRSQAEVIAHRHRPFPAAARSGGMSGPGFDTIVSPIDDDHVLPQAISLRVAFRDEGTRCTLRLRYDTRSIDDDYAARIAGYHVSALCAMARDVEADHHRHRLLSADEMSLQLDGLAGPARRLPDRRVHELFEDRVRAHPDRVAVVHGGRQWTYAQLNARANQLGRRLLAQGLAAEDVVAVVTERNLEWLASVLAIFKAGGAYLPLEPHFPAERIARVLTRSACRLVLTESAASTTLPAALDTLDGVEMLVIDDLSAPPGSSEAPGSTDASGSIDASGSDDDLGVVVGADQLAYLYFTSGSTGEPKGAMCEHAGMLNHLFAKIDDLGIGPGDVVAQTAPQCFDISLWQLVAALVVGGHTLIVEQETILDAERFVDTVADGGVNVVQVVPSYLEAILTYLETRSRRLPALRCVSATGEALKAELARRWFAAVPGVRLVNAYGLTETSDDTNHEVMDSPPLGDRVPLGPAVNNVRIYVVDDRLVPVPLGAPGAIVFSGVCVGRGYVNDPQRTAEAYLEDPYRPGERLYRGGDFGRWLPGGKLDFLGRRDHQVKIAGFRIEIGEVENALARVPGVKDGAVVVTERANGVKQLAAFYSSAAPMEADTIRSGLGADLPDYMVPHDVHWCRTLPLTANGKIDRAALVRLAAEEAATVGVDAAQTPTEHRLAAAWSALLSIPSEQIGRADHFFDRGGTSLSAVKLAIALDRAVTLKDLLAHPVLSDLARLIDTRAAGGTTRPAAAPAEQRR